MTELEWWATAPEWAKWHTWDDLGKVWWQIRPQLADGRWFGTPSPQDTIAEHIWYDQTPLPIEIDPSKTLRRRPKAVTA